MTERSNIDYSHLDLPEILMGLFHPRPEYGSMEPAANTINVMIPVESNILVAGRFHITEKSAPNILFFHGNGEIAGDYDELGPIYNRMGLNLLVMDYRGYGRSTGSPTVSTMMRDCHTIFDFTKRWLGENGYGGAFIVMGRSLGSASALELISRHKDRINGLVLESSFANTGTLLEFLGVNTSEVGFSEEKGFRNLEKIRIWHRTTLIIHAEFDHFFPFSEAQGLYDACPSPHKTLLKIPGANHNDIFMRGLEAYMKSIKVLSEAKRDRDALASGA
jgi:pimeloyl-ACP methyl ester carboxylesterase